MPSRPPHDLRPTSRSDLVSPALAAHAAALLSSAPSLRRSTVTVSTARQVGDALDEAPTLRAAPAGSVNEEGTGERRRGTAQEAAHPCGRLNDPHYEVGIDYMRSIYCPKTPKSPGVQLPYELRLPTS